MEIRKRTEGEPKQVAQAVRIEEYGFQRPETGVARVHMNGRYPEEGYMRNQECDELVFVFYGIGQVESPDGNRKIAAGDMIQIPAGEAFAWKGGFELIVFTAPERTPEQYEAVSG